MNDPRYSALYEEIYNDLDDAIRLKNIKPTADKLTKLVLAVLDLEDRLDKLTKDGLPAKNLSPRRSVAPLVDPTLDEPSPLQRMSKKGASVRQYQDSNITATGAVIDGTVFGNSQAKFYEALKTAEQEDRERRRLLQEAEKRAKDAQLEAPRRIIAQLNPKDVESQENLKTQTTGTETTTSPSEEFSFEQRSPDIGSTIEFYEKAESAWVLGTYSGYKGYTSENKNTSPCLLRADKKLGSAFDGSWFMYPSEKWRYPTKDKEEKPEFKPVRRTFKDVSPIIGSKIKVLYGSYPFTGIYAGILKSDTSYSSSLPYTLRDDGNPGSGPNKEFGVDIGTKWEYVEEPVVEADIPNRTPLKEFGTNPPPIGSRVVVQYESVKFIGTYLGKQPSTPYSGTYQYVKRDDGEKGYGPQGAFAVSEYSTWEYLAVEATYKAELVFDLGSEPQLNPRKVESTASTETEIEPLPVYDPNYVPKLGDRVILLDGTNMIGEVVAVPGQAFNGTTLGPKNYCMICEDGRGWSLKAYAEFDGKQGTGWWFGADLYKPALLKPRSKADKDMKPRRTEEVKEDLPSWPRVQPGRRT